MEFEDLARPRIRRGFDSALVWFGAVACDSSPIKREVAAPSPGAEDNLCAFNHGLGGHRSLSMNMMPYHGGDPCTGGFNLLLQLRLKSLRGFSFRL